MVQAEVCQLGAVYTPSLYQRLQNLRESHASNVTKYCADTHTLSKDTQERRSAISSAGTLPILVGSGQQKEPSQCAHNAAHLLSPSLFSIIHSRLHPVIQLSPMPAGT